MLTVRDGTRRGTSVALALVAVLLLTACSRATDPSASATAAPDAGPVETLSDAGATDVPGAPDADPVTADGLDGDGVVTFAVVGDSLSLGDSWDFENGVAGELSWVSHAEDEAADFVGGTAVVGAPSWVQAQRALPVEADALVLALGTNDMSADLGFTATAEALVSIVETVGAPRVLLLAVPPRTYERAVTTTQFNGWLQGLAAEHDWEFVDAPAPVRDGEAWAPGMTTDGIHYTRAAVALVGAYVGEALRGER